MATKSGQLLTAKRPPCVKGGLDSCIQHVFDKDAVAGARVVDENVSNSAEEFADLQNRTSRHFCVK